MLPTLPLELSESDRPLSCPQAAILGSILADFGSDALAWDVLARQHVPPGVWNGPDPWPGVERAIGTYRQGLERAPEAEIVRLLAAFLEEQLGHGLAAAAAEDAQAAVRAAVARTYASLEQVRCAAQHSALHVLAFLSMCR